jgi:cytochrome c biogenesis protein CcmG, thiol:disulfide interchange protein DsbE
MSRRWFPILVMIPALLLAACGERGGRALEGRTLPAYRAADLDGTPVDLAGLRGEAVLLNVWATWCTPCRREMPALEELHRDYARRGLRVVAVSIDGAGSEADIHAFLAEHGITFTILHDPAQRIQRRFGLLGVPETFLIDADGIIRRRWIGRIDPRSPSIRNQVLDVMERRFAAGD